MAGLSLRDLSEIERWFRELKNRTKRFYKYINAKTLKSLEELQTAIAAMHNIIRKEEGGNTNLTVPEEGKDKNKCGCNVSKRYQRRS
jgi:transposase-like protein